MKLWPRFIYISFCMSICMYVNHFLFVTELDTLILKLQSPFCEAGNGEWWQDDCMLLCRWINLHWLFKEQTHYIVLLDHNEISSQCPCFSPCGNSLVGVPCNLDPWKLLTFNRPWQCSLHIECTWGFLLAPGFSETVKTYGRSRWCKKITSLELSKG